MNFGRMSGFSLMVGFCVVGLVCAESAEGAPRCGEELTVDTSLYYDFGVDPRDLPWLSDTDALAQISAIPNRLKSRTLSLSRSLIWEGILKYRIVDGGCGSEIPLESGRWRTGRVVHPESRRVYEVVHWDDIDDGSYTVYFIKGTPWLCQVAYEN